MLSHSHAEGHSLPASQSPITHESPKILKKVSAYRKPSPSKDRHWYENISQADVNGEMKLVKVYYNKAEAEESFLRDLQYLAQNPFVHIQCSLNMASPYPQIP